MKQDHKKKQLPLAHSLTVFLGRISPEHKLLYQKIVFLLAALFCLTPWATPPVALMLGIVLALTHENPFDRISRPAAKYLLEASVIMLGFGMNLAVVLKAGSSGAMFAVGSITATFVLGYYLGQWLKIPIKASALISAGTAICGGSA